MRNTFMRRYTQKNQHTQKHIKYSTTCRVLRVRIADSANVEHRATHRQTVTSEKPLAELLTSYLADRPHATHTRQQQHTAPAIGDMENCSARNACAVWRFMYAQTYISNWNKTASYSVCTFRYYRLNWDEFSRKPRYYDKTDTHLSL